jgi:integrase
VRSRCARGYTPVNPVSQLGKGERPQLVAERAGPCNRKEITTLLQSATTYRYRVVPATATFSGLRLMELLGLRWQDVDFEEAELRIRHQLSRKGALAPVKSESGEREVTLRPELAKVLREWNAASRFKRPHDFVFASETGGHLGWCNVERRAMDAAFAGAVKAKRLPAGRRKLVLHDCRHTFGSLLIREGHNVYMFGKARLHGSLRPPLPQATRARVPPLAPSRAARRPGARPRARALRVVARFR